MYSEFKTVSIFFFFVLFIEHMCKIIITKPGGSLRETIVSESQVSQRDRLHAEKAEAHSGVDGDGWEQI